MGMNGREFWTVLHGMVFGAVFLLAFAGGFAGLWSLRPRLITEEGLRERLVRMHVGLWAMVVMCWATVITGTYVVYPWYRDPAPESPRSMLVGNPDRAAWHTFGMEWKEHVAWLAPILATAVAIVVWRYGRDLTKRPELRRSLLVLHTLAFAAAAVAGAFGAFINKVAPIW